MAVQNYYKLPLRFSSLFDDSNRMLARCSEKESIDQYLELILLTCPGEHRFDPEFGSYIWDLDFERMDSADRWKEKFIGYVKEAIIKNEKRLENMAIRVDITDSIREDETLKAFTVKKRADVYIEGDLKSTGERTLFLYKIYLGPLTNQ
ncbi:MAG: GPW/gp25 family protein [Tannerellaceae bacterium]|nr:GPW/gp25 family protein [Tannerellaceae bacterium]